MNVRILIAERPEEFLGPALAIPRAVIDLSISAVANLEEVATAPISIIRISHIIPADVITRLNGIADLIARGSITVYRDKRSLIRLRSRSDLAILRKEEENWFFLCAFVLVHAVVGAAATINDHLLQSEGRFGSI